METAYTAFTAGQGRDYRLRLIADLRGRADVKMSTDEILALTRDD